MGRIQVSAGAGRGAQRACKQLNECVVLEERRSQDVTAADPGGPGAGGPPQAPDLGTGALPAPPTVAAGF